MNFKVTILPDQAVIEVAEGTDLLKACYRAGIGLDSPCGGRGTCGKCAVKPITGDPAVDDEIDFVLACNTKVTGDMTIEIPEFSRLKKQKVLLESYCAKEREQKIEVNNPIVKRIRLTLDKPSLADSMNDVDRIRLALLKCCELDLEELYFPLSVLRKTPDTLRKCGFVVTVTLVFDGYRWRIIDIEPCKIQKSAYCAAIDIGTTTVAAVLVDAESGQVIDRAGTYNKQSVFGSDVISRIIYGEEQGKEGKTALRQAVVNSINEVLEVMIKRNDLRASDIKAAVCAGNTVMTHLFMGVSADYLRIEPYAPAAVDFPSAKARELGLEMHSEALVLTVPSVASYVGGDITAGVLATGFSDEEELTLFIDIGTNGELVLGNSDWMMTCSCSAGPAFEGSGVKCGMRAMEGAINHISIDKDTLKPNIGTIGNMTPLGICGTGLINALDVMQSAGVIDRAGRMVLKNGIDRLRETEEGKEYVLAYEQEYGNEQTIAITENDVQNLLRAKAAIFAGIRIMLDKVQLPLQAIQRVYIAGGFGSSIDIGSAIDIGLLPDMPLKLYSYVGNSSLQGALTVLLNCAAIEKSRLIASRMTYLELSVGNSFMEEFVSALFLPHTDLSLFPNRGSKGIQ